MGGDLTGKAIAPIVERDGAWIAEVLGERYVGRDERELEELRQRLRRRGLYDVVMTEDEIARLTVDPSGIEDAVRRAMKESLARWIRLAEERLERDGLTAFIMLGNDDPPELAEILREGTRLKYVGEDVSEVPGGFELVSCGYSTPTPWQSPREISDEELGELIRGLIELVSDKRRAIFNLHCPPRDTQLDQAPLLDEEFRPKAGPGGMRMGPVGSVSVRTLIEKHQPMVGLHGHVHESPGVETLGLTPCVNPGSLYEQGILRGALVELDRNAGLRSWQLVEG
jgi:Icc-related predicted phosphoesterase